MAQEQNANALFEEALLLIKKSAWKDAIERMAELRARGLVSADLENNLGRAFCEAGDFGSCVEHLNNAVALDRFDSGYRNDLAVGQSRVESGMGQPFNHPSENAHLLASYLRPIEILSLASIVFLVILALHFLKKLTRKYLMILGFTGCTFTLLSAFTFFASHIAIIKIDTELKFGPLESADTVQTLKSGTRVRYIRESGPYVEVERTNSFRGWLKADTLVKSPF